MSSVIIVVPSELVELNKLNSKICIAKTIELPISYVFGDGYTKLTWHQFYEANIADHVSGFAKACCICDTPRPATYNGWLIHNGRLICPECHEIIAKFYRI